MMDHMFSVDAIGHSFNYYKTDLGALTSKMHDKRFISLPNECTCSG